MSNIVTIVTDIYELNTSEYCSLKELDGVSHVTQRKVRKDFNPAREYRVDVSGCTEEEKKEVQQAFFDAGFPWETSGKKYKYLDAAQYTNTTINGVVTPLLMYGGTSEDCNMTVKEFLALVYEPEQAGHDHVNRDGAVVDLDVVDLCTEGDES